MHVNRTCPGSAYAWSGAYFLKACYLTFLGLYTIVRDIPAQQPAGQGRYVMTEQVIPGEFNGFPIVQRRLRGFAGMEAQRQREIASKGGQSVPDEKRSFSQDPKLAAAAGRLGGKSVPGHLRSFSQNPALAAAAGRKGGQVSSSNKKKTAADQ